jgi:hypothetical protein
VGGVTRVALEVVLQPEDEWRVHSNGDALPCVQRGSSAAATLDTRYRHASDTGALPDLLLGQTLGRAPIAQLSTNTRELLAVPPICFHAQRRAPDSGHEHHMFIVGLSWRSSPSYGALRSVLSAAAHARCASKQT